MQFAATVKTSTRFLFALALVAGCSSTSQTDIADTTVNGQPFHVFREGPMPAAGVSTNLVLKPVSGTKPDTVVAWVGTDEAEQSAKTTCDYDSADGDFDCPVTCPDPMPAGAKIYFTIAEGDAASTVSVDIK